MKALSYFLPLLLLIITSCDGTHSTAHQGKKRIAVTDTSLRWTDYHIGEPPPVDYYRGFDSTVKKWGIRYQRIDGGCEDIPEERRKYEKDNPRYFRILEKRFGKDWRRRFYSEVRLLDSIFDDRPPVQ